MQTYETDNIKMCQRGEDVVIHHKWARHQLPQVIKNITIKQVITTYKKHGLIR